MSHVSVPLKEKCEKTSYGIPSQHSKVPQKCNIFVNLFFTSSKPIWVDDRCLINNRRRKEDLKTGQNYFFLQLLTLFYTRGLGIVVSHEMVSLPYRFSLGFFT
jgi:hypothetical protein